MKNYYYNESIKKTTGLFARLFTNIKCYQYDEDGAVKKEINVGVTISSQEKARRIIQSTGALDVVLPRISVTWTGITPDTDRQLNRDMERQVQIITEDGEQTGVKTSLTPLPYKFTYLVTIWADKLNHMAQLIENIVPSVQPRITIPVKGRFGELSAIYDAMTIEMTGETPNIKTVMADNEDNFFQYEMNFSVDSYIYKALVTETDDIIKEINILHKAGSEDVNSASSIRVVTGGTRLDYEYLIDLDDTTLY